MFPSFKEVDHVAMPIAGYSQLESYPEYSLPPVTRINRDGKEEIIYTSDVYNLFNQERFAGVAQNIVDSIRSNILAAGSQYQSILDNLSDEELFAAVKPRSIQSPAELMAYSKSVMAYLDSRLSVPESNVVEDTSSEDNNQKPD